VYGDLLNTVSQNKIDVPADLRPVNFLQLMASSFSHLRQAATNNSVKLPDNFAFGFGRYAGPPATLPARNLSPDDTKKVLDLLVKQLSAIDQISTLLINNHVAEITQIRRSEVEPGGGGEALNMQISNDPKGLYEVLPFEFQFSGTSKALQGFLNDLTQSKWFFVVKDIQFAGEAPATAGAPSNPGGHGPSMVPTSPATPGHSELTVTIRIDLIEFPTKKEPPKPGT